jgi:acyl-coenzyme A thioesterase PaaI-like protein
MREVNRLGRMVRLCRKLPRAWQGAAITRLFNGAVRFAGTAGIRIVAADFERAEMRLDNRRKVRNHIGGVHAAATALLGESVTGLVFGLNVPDDKLPLLKAMEVDYLRRANGGLTAVAHLSDAQIEQIRTTEKGEVAVAVTITDDDGERPVEARYLWAWVPKKR